MSKKSKSIITDGVKFQMPTLTMSSVEIAKLSGKRHDNVKTDITKMLHELELRLPEFSGSLKNEQNQTVEVFNLPKRECLILVSGYSTKLRATIIDRWLELEKAFANPPRAGLLQDKRSAHHPMMDALIDARTDVGKDTSYIHFMRENKLCNGVVTGNFKSVDESGLSNSDVALLAEVRRMNQSMLQMDLSYDERKKKLTVFALKRRTKLIG